MKFCMVKKLGDCIKTTCANCKSSFVASAEKTKTSSQELFFTMSTEMPFHRHSMTTPFFSRMPRILSKRKQMRENAEKTLMLLVDHSSKTGRSLHSVDYCSDFCLLFYTIEKRPCECHSAVVEAI